MKTVKTVNIAPGLFALCVALLWVTYVPACSHAHSHAHSHVPKRVPAPMTPTPYEPLLTAADSVRDSSPKTRLAPSKSPSSSPARSHLGLEQGEAVSSQANHAPAPPAFLGIISRKEMLAYHRAGPQSFMQQIRVKAAFHRRNFLGWRLLAYNGPGPLKRGDIVLSVNSGELERPKQFMRVWNQLLRRPELVVELLRAGQRVTLRYRITD